MACASVIIPARNAVTTLPRTLQALARQRFGDDYEVIVVDDGSRDRTAEVARAHGATEVLSQPPLGPAAARNLGVEHSTGQWLAFCDADVYPTPGWLEAGVRALSSADIVQGKVLPDPEAAPGPFNRSIWITHEVGLFETASLFVTRQMFDRVGGFEQWIAPGSGKHLAEDVWFGYSALRSGAHSAFCPDALAHHAVFQRAWTGYVGERLRLRYFPAMARKMPEMRRRFLYRRLFLTPRSARFDLAALCVGLAVRTRSPLPLVGAAPYLRASRTYAKRSWPVGPRASVVSLADAVADVVGLVALSAGSARYRALVL